MQERAQLMTKEQKASIVETIVKLHYADEGKEWGFFPFQLYVREKSAKVTIASLALGGDVAGCYKIASKYINEDLLQLILAVDFPPTGDIDHDFVGIFCVDARKKVEAFAMPYDNQTGEWLPIVTNSISLNIITQHFRAIGSR